MQQTDVKAVTLTATGSAVSGRQRVKGVYAVASGTAGSIVLRDGGSGGTTRLDVAVPGTSDDLQVFIPGDGILFDASVHATITNATSVTIFYG